MEINEKIEARRKELGLSDTEVAQHAGLSIYEYGDIEQHTDEIITVTELHEVKKLCSVLKLDFCDLFDLTCLFCGEARQYPEDYLLPRHLLIRKKREALGLSREDLANRIGFDTTEIDNLENSPDHLETWPIDYVRDLSKEIDVPLQVLLDVRCIKCDH